MRVCIPIEFRPQGGGFYFLQTFANFLGKSGWKVTQDLTEKYDVLFTNHWMTPAQDILNAIRHNPKVRVVQRIDGAAQNYGRDAEADERQAKVNRFADLTIFQSQYARFSTREKFAIIGQDGPIIYNPVDVEIFRPEGPVRELPGNTRIACVTWSTNPYKGAAQIYAVAKGNPDIDFVLCGNFTDAPDLPNLHQLGLLNRADLATALRSCRALLTFSKNEACPNHVLEALASGLPVLYEDSGAMAEVIADCGLPVTTQSFSVELKKILKDWERLSGLARKRATEHFHPQKTLSKYVEVILEALERPLHVPQTKRSVLAWASLVIPRAS